MFGQGSRIESKVLIVKGGNIMFCKQCGGYLQPVNRFCMRCGCQNISAVITHPPKVKRNKKTLFAWQQLIVVDSPSRLVFNEKSLTEHTQPIVHRDFEIVTDCQNLIQTTATGACNFSAYSFSIASAFARSS